MPDSVRLIHDSGTLAYRADFEVSQYSRGIPTIGLGCLDDLAAPRLGLDQTHDLFGRQPFDFRCPEPQLCQNDSTVLADARRRASDLGRGAIEARRGFGLADEPDVRMVQLDDELARHYLLVGDHLIAPQ